MQNYKLDFTELFVNKGEVNCDIEYKDNGKVDINLSSQGLKAGYYPIYIVNEEVVNIDNFGQYELYINNLDNTALRANIAVSTKKYDVLDIPDGKYAIFENSNGETDFQLVENGCFEIPANFSGVLKIPFSILNIDEEIINSGLSDSYGFGLSVVLEENQTANINIESANLKNSLIEKNTAASIIIEGSDKVLNPIVGESIEMYRAKVFDIQGNIKESNYKFYIEDNKNENVSITDDGIITVKEGNKADSVTINVITDEGLVDKREIELYNSWTLSNKTEKGYDASIASTDQVKMVVEENNIWLNNQFLVSTRVAGIGAFIMFIVYYLTMRKKYSGHKKKRG